MPQPDTAREVAEQKVAEQKKVPADTVRTRLPDAAQPSKLPAGRSPADPDATPGAEPPRLTQRERQRQGDRVFDRQCEGKKYSKSGWTVARKAFESGFVVDGYMAGNIVEFVQQCKDAADDAVSEAYKDQVIHADVGDDKDPGVE